MKKALRGGFSTGACAAAAAKAAAQLLFGKAPSEIDIPFPDGSRERFPIHRLQLDGGRAVASVIKDAGDDPDVTQGAEIVATVKAQSAPGARSLLIKGGPGVGMITKPGLPLPPGEAAINPVPRLMIQEALADIFCPPDIGDMVPMEVTVSVPGGELLAKKTLNPRLGIIGGISILGTTGRVTPISALAWTATIISSLRVARAMGKEEIVLSAGRTSERAHEKTYALPPECYALMGDYVEMALRAAAECGFARIHLAAQWAKLLKIALGSRQTHVRFGVLKARNVVQFLDDLGIEIGGPFNTAREIFTLLERRHPEELPVLLTAVCRAARKRAEIITGGRSVCVHLVSYEGMIIAQDG